LFGLHPVIFHIRLRIPHVTRFVISSLVPLETDDNRTRTPHLAFIQMLKAQMVMVVELSQMFTAAVTRANFGAAFSHVFWTFE
jgi:hypothetical protein